MKVLLYGRLADAIGREAELDLSSGTVAEIRRRLAERHPTAADALRHSRAVRREAVIAEDALISSTDAIELLPPVCGG